MSFFMATKQSIWKGTVRNFGYPASSSCPWLPSRNFLMQAVQTLNLLHDPFCRFLFLPFLYQFLICSEWSFKLPVCEDEYCFTPSPRGFRMLWAAIPLVQRIVFRRQPFFLRHSASARAAYALRSRHRHLAPLPQPPRPECFHFPDTCELLYMYVYPILPQAFVCGGGVRRYFWEWRVLGKFWLGWALNCFGLTGSWDCNYPIFCREGVCKIAQRVWGLSSWGYNKLCSEEGC